MPRAGARVDQRDRGEGRGDRQDVVDPGGDHRQVTQVEARREGQVRYPVAGFVVPVEVGATAAYGVDDCALSVQEIGGRRR